jgi:hypothetical protein
MFEAPLNSAIAVLTEYYDKTASSDAFIIAMCQFHSHLFIHSIFNALSSSSSQNEDVPFCQTLAKRASRTNGHSQPLLNHFADLIQPVSRFK